MSEYNENQLRQNISLKQDAQVTFFLRGSRIIQIDPVGRFNKETLNALINRLQDYRKMIRLLKTDIILLLNFKEMKSCPLTLFKTIKKWNGKEECREASAVIGYNTDFLKRTVFNSIQQLQTFSEFYKICASENIANGYAISLLLSRQIYTVYNQEKGLYRETIFENSSYREKMVLLDKSIIYSDIQGPLSNQILKQRFSILEDFIHSETDKESPLIHIYRWRETAHLSLRNYRAFITALFNLKRIIPLQRIILIPDSYEIRQMFSTSRIQMPVDVFIAESVNQGLSKALQLPENFLFIKSQILDPLSLGNQSVITTKQFRSYLQEIEDFIKQLPNLNYRELQNLNEERTPDHPLNKIYKTLTTFYVSQLENKISLSDENSELKKAGNYYYLLLEAKPLLTNTVQNWEELKKILHDKLEADHVSLFMRSSNKEPLRCVSDWTENSEKREGRIIPVPLALFLNSLRLTVASEQDLIVQAEARNRDLIPYIRTLFESIGSSYIAVLNFYQDDECTIILEFSDKSQPLFDKDEIESVFQKILLFDSRNEQEEIPLLDYQTAIDEYDGDEEFYHEVLSHFFDHSHEHIEIMSRAKETNDDDTFRRECHKIKGAAANLYAVRLQKISGDLEDAIKNGEKDKYNSYFESLKTELEQLKNSLQERH